MGIKIRTDGHLGSQIGDPYLRKVDDIKMVVGKHWTGERHDSESGKLLKKVLSSSEWIRAEQEDKKNNIFPSITEYISYKLFQDDGLTRPLIMLTSLWS